MNPYQTPRLRGPRWLKAWFVYLEQRITAATPLRSETCEVHETAGGTQILPVLPPLPGRKTPQNPYVMGSTAGGSLTGGGSGDAPPAPSSTAYHDEWDITAPPLDVTDATTDGVIYQPRFYNDGGSTLYIFTRALTCNADGILTHVGPESLQTALTTD